MSPSPINIFMLSVNHALLMSLPNESRMKINPPFLHLILGTAYYSLLYTVDAALFAILMTINLPQNCVW